MKTVEQLYIYCTDPKFSNLHARNWVSTIEQDLWKVLKEYKPYCQGEQLFQAYSPIQDSVIPSLCLLLSNKCHEEVILADMYPLCARIFQDIAERLTEKFALHVGSSNYRVVFCVNDKKEAAWFLGPHIGAMNFDLLFMSQGYEAAALAMKCAMQ